MDARSSASGKMGMHGVAETDRDIRIDGRQRASIRLPKETFHFETVEDAIKHWCALPPEEREHAVLILQSGQVFQPAEIELLKVSPSAK